MKYSLLMLGVGLLAVQALLRESEMPDGGGVGEESVVEPGGDGTATVTELSQQASDAEYVDATPQADALSGFAHYEIAEQYASGVGVLQNDEEALRHYRLSAELGNNAGLFALGEVYHEGVLLQRDVAEARRLWGLVAERGETWSGTAMTTLAVCYQHLDHSAGDRDREAAYMWLILALSRMDPQGRGTSIPLGILSGLVDARERLSQGLSDEQRDEVDHRAREWDAAHPRQ